MIPNLLFYRSLHTHIDSKQDKGAGLYDRARSRALGCQVLPAGSWPRELRVQGSCSWVQPARCQTLEDSARALYPEREPPLLMGGLRLLRPLPAGAVLAPLRWRHYWEGGQLTSASRC